MSVVDAFSLEWVWSCWSEARFLGCVCVEVSWYWMLSFVAGGVVCHCDLGVWGSCVRLIIVVSMCVGLRADGFAVRWCWCVVRSCVDDRLCVVSGGYVAVWHCAMCCEVNGR